MRYKLDEQKWHSLQLSEKAITRKQVKGRNQKTIQIPEQYCYIGNYTFQNMTKLRAVHLPNSCRVIGKKAFENCQIEGTLVIPKSVTVIQEGAFERNASLKEVHISENIKILGKSALKECRQLCRAVIAPESLLPEISECVFDCCTELKEIILPDSLERIERRAFYRCKKLTQISFPETLKKIGTEAFYFNALEELHLPEHLTELEEAAFFKCTMLKHVIIPCSVKRIGKWAFHGCSRLKTIEILHDPEYIGDWIVNRSTTVRCQKGSKVEAYCKEFGFETEFVEY